MLFFELCKKKARKVKIKCKKNADGGSAFEDEGRLAAVIV